MCVSSPVKVVVVSFVEVEVEISLCINNCQTMSGHDREGGLTFPQFPPLTASSRTSVLVTLSIYYVFVLKTKESSVSWSLRAVNLFLDDVKGLYCIIFVAVLRPNICNASALPKVPI